MDWSLETAALKFAFELLHGSMPTTPGQRVVAQNQNGLITVEPSTRHQGFTVKLRPALAFDPLWSFRFIVELKGDVTSAKGKGECMHKLDQRFTALLGRYPPEQGCEQSTLQGKESIRRCRLHYDWPCRRWSRRRIRVKGAG